MTPTAWLQALSAVGLTMALAMAPGGASAQSPRECQGEPTGAKLMIIVEGIHNARGDMTATLYGEDPAKFLKSHGELKVWRDPAQAPTQDMCIWLPGPGVYAVALYQDSNGSHHFDHGAFGPTEAYGFSRNPRLFFGPPSVGQVKFAAGEGDTTVHIRLRYPVGG
jgi:uncharacterized protein (DUF2141 family)